MSNIEVGEQLYEYTLKITGVTDYGDKRGPVLAGEMPPSPEGIRFDVHFEGEATGKLGGHVVGIDYVHLRADGRADLHIHATLTMANGNKLALFADGVAMPAAPGVFELRENCTWFSADADTMWLNPIQIWGIGTVDLVNGVIHVTGYSA